MVKTIPTILVFLLIVTGCNGLKPGAEKSVKIIWEVVEEAKPHIKWQEQLDNTWKLWHEIDLANADCVGITTWLIGNMIDRGADPELLAYGIFKEYNPDRWHMAILFYGFEECMVIPSSRLKTISMFIPLEEYEESYKMILIESFQIYIKEID